MPGLQVKAPVCSKEIHHLSFEDALSSVRKSLAEQKLIVTSDVDMKTVLKEQLETDISNYRILSVCLPWEAYEVIVASSEAGALLTCDIALYEPIPGRSVLSWEKPQPVSRQTFPTLAIYRENLEFLLEQALMVIP